MSKDSQNLRYSIYGSDDDDLLLMDGRLGEGLRFNRVTGASRQAEGMLRCNLVDRSDDLSDHLYD